MTSPKRWLLRFWLLLAFCWLAIVGHAQRDELCASLLWPTPQERAQRAIVLEKNLAIPGQSSEAKERLIVDSEKHNTPAPVIACYPTTLSSQEARKAGGETIDWNVRSPALILWLAPPAVILILGLLLLWVAGAFQQEPKPDSPEDGTHPDQQGGGYDLPEGR